VNTNLKLLMYIWEGQESGWL